MAAATVTQLRISGVPGARFRRSRGQRAREVAVALDERVDDAAVQLLVDDLVAEADRRP